MLTEDIKRQKLANLYFLLFILAFFFIRVFVYLRYSVKFVDTDQAYMWLGASDFAQGIFMEPRYYGQSYNTFMEALFAVPLAWVNVPVYYAVPAATQFISGFPFYFTAFYLFKNGRKYHALFVLALLLCFPIHYDLLNSLPRGFVTGLFFCSFFIVSLLNPKRMGMLTVNAFLAVTGYYVNPNSVLVSVPCLVYLFFHNYSNLRLYFIGLAALFFAVLNYYFFDELYVRHPEYIQNPLMHRFTTDFFMNNLSNLDQRFAHITFFEEHKSWSILLLIAIVAVLLYRQNKPAFFAFLCMPCIVLFSFCLGKITEGTDWVYISYSRMFLGIPLLLCLFGSFISVRIPGLHVLLLFPLLFTVYKCFTHEQALAKHFDHTNFMGVRVYPLPVALDAINVYKKACTDNNTDFMLVSNGFIYNNFLAYGGPAVDKGYPQTLETKLEKRHWVRDRFRDSVITKFIFVSTRWDLDTRIPNTPWFRIKNLDGYGIVLIEDNTFTMGKFIEVVNAYERVD